MDVRLNAGNSLNNNYNSPAFTAQLRGSAVKMAMKSAIDGFQVGEIPEILDKVAAYGDNATKINCNADGLVSVCNDKFGDIIHKFKLPKNERSKNPFLDFLRTFNSENGILKVEYNLFDCIFEHSKNLAVKQGKYKLYSTLALNTSTKTALDAAAKKHGLTGSAPVSENSIQAKQSLENLKEILLKNMSQRNVF